MKKNPKVSILCLTYNHEKYIRQTLESFLMQKTNFEFEVLINDDASTDDTPKIIKGYQNKYPNIIKPIFQKDNQYSKGKRGFITKVLIPKAKGEYVALCDGDDFFTDENKLQLQANFLDKNPDYSICFHKVRWFYENKELEDRIYPNYLGIKEFTLEELLKGNFMPTSSVMHRKKNYKNLSNITFVPADWYINAYHARFGKIGFINKIMSSYRKHKEGIWWNSYKDPRMLIKINGMSMIAMQYKLYILFGMEKKYEHIILSNIRHLINEFINIDKKYKTQMVKRVVIKYPDIMSELLTESIKTIVIWNKELQQNEIDKQNLIKEINDIKLHHKNLKDILSKIKLSKFFKL